MLQIDETTVSEHFSLAASDYCFYIWEYSARQRYDFSPTNQLISNLKIKPTRIAANPPRAYYKQEAMEHAACALHQLIQRNWVDQHGTLVSMPPSKVIGHPDYDDRILKLLRIAFAGCNADIRPLLEQTASTPADHESAERLSFSELLALTRINESCAYPTRSNIAVVDDVLNSGKHFKVVQQLLARRFPGIPFVGVFIARCIRPDV